MFLVLSQRVELLCHHDTGETARQKVENRGVADLVRYAVSGMLLIGWNVLQDGRGCSSYRGRVWHVLLHT